MNKKIHATILGMLLVVGMSACGTATVPDVTGQSLSDAKSSLSAEGFNNVEAKDSDGNIAIEGTVSDQTPSPGSEESTSTKVELTVRTSADRVEEIKATAESLKGRPATDAIKTLQEMDALGDITLQHGAETEDNVQRIIDDSDMGIEWVVVDVEVHTILSQTVDLTVDTQSNIDAQNAAGAQKNALNEKLSTTAALAACREYGKDMYPYGFDTHDVLGVIQDFTPSDDNTWFYKATVDVTNAFGATAEDMTYECYVTGTTDNPQVSAFNVY